MAKSLAVTISVSGVMLAVAELALPVATLCKVPLPSGLVTSNTQGRLPLLITTW